MKILNRLKVDFIFHRGSETLIHYWTIWENNIAVNIQIKTKDSFISQISSLYDDKMIF